jgi:CRISPR-associated exonuclease Cas4
LNVDILLLALAGILLVIALRLRRHTGIPWAPIRYIDTDAAIQVEQPLVSRQYGVVGKPDYVIETRAGLIPIEVKPGRNASEPYDSDLLQLAAYCLLIEESTGHAPPYGLLRYARQTFRMPYTSELREYLLELLDDMREAEAEDDVVRSHNQRSRCHNCGFFDICDDRIK